MKLKPLLIITIAFLSISALTAQESDGYVDVKETNNTIAVREEENSNHSDNIAAEKERKTFLENRIQTSESRLAEIAESLDYSQETLGELNEINSETKDRETKKRLENGRNDLRNIIWLLRAEQTSLTNQVEKDTNEIDFLTRDIARREMIIERNKSEIEVMKQSVAATEAKINEISSKLDTIIGRIDGFREDVTP